MMACQSQIPMSFDLLLIKHLPFHSGDLLVFYCLMGKSLTGC